MSNYVDLHSLTKKELRMVAKEWGVPYKFKMNKVELLEAIEEWQKEAAKHEVKIDEPSLSVSEQPSVAPMSVRVKRIYEANKGG